MRSILFLCFLGWSVLATAQDLYTGQKHSTNQFLFKITESQAQKLHTQKNAVPDDSFFQNIIDTFSFDKEYIVNAERQLAIGHYLTAQVKGESLTYRYFSNAPYDVKVLQNNTELVIQVLDQELNNYKGAKVKLGKRRVYYDKRSGTYRFKRKIYQEILSVEVEGHTTYYEIHNEDKHKKKWWQKVLYGKPQRYLTLPVRHLLLLPIDGYRSIRRHHPVGTINTTVAIAKRINSWIDCVFVKSTCREQQYHGYMVTSKPKYKLYDTLKVKGFYTRKKGWPLEKRLDLYLNNQGKKIKLVNLKPYSPGGYEYQFVLDEKLKLKIDQYYQLEFKYKNQRVGQTSFRLEQYELKSIDFKVTKERDHFAGEPFKINIEARDENDLPIFDGRVKLKVTPGKITSFKADSVFIPTILLDTLIDLRTDSITTFLLSEANFPNADFDYKVNLELLNAENQKIKKIIFVKYFHKKETVKFVLEKDSILLSYFLNDKAGTKSIELIGSKGHPESLGNLELPAKIKLNAAYDKYIIKWADQQRVFNVGSHAAEVQVLTRRDANTLYVNVENPRNIGFSYFLYKANAEIDRGFGKSLNLKKAIHRTKNYVFSIEYLWGGKVINTHYEIPSREKEIQLVVEHPDIIFPGQTTKVGVQALNYRNRPLVNVDITAFGFTDKFKQGTTLPYPVYKKKKKKLVRDNYILEKSTKIGQRKIDFDLWNPLAGLDSMTYYNFLFPGDELFRKEYPTEDSITQLAPFVVLDGQLEKVHIVTIDSRPVYFSWATNQRPYSFRVSPGNHRVELRTSSYVIVLDKVEIKPGVKNILSVNVMGKVKGMRRWNSKEKLSKGKIQNYARYNFAYDNNFNAQPTYLKQGKEIILLSNPYYRKRYAPIIAGPLLPATTTIKQLEGFEFNFINEPEFKYEFQSGLMKLRQFDFKRSFEKPLDELVHTAVKPSLKDTVFTENTIDKIYRNYLLELRKKNLRFYSKSRYASENGSLTLHFKERTNGKKALNILIYNLGNYNDFDILPITNNHISAIEKGKHRIVVLYEEGYYKVMDSLRILAQGINYYNLENLPLQAPDAFSIEVDSILMATAASKFKVITEAERKQIYQSSLKKYSGDYQGNFIIGKVKDVNGEGLIGAVVIVRGTNIGVTTDFDGNFKIKVPEGYQELEVSYVGYMSEVLTDVQNDYGDREVILSNAGVSLEEVVVMGYRTPLAERDMTTSATTVTALGMRDVKGLAGKVAGVQVSDELGDISIRGSRAGSTIYYVDGIRVNGNAADLDKETVANIRVVSGAEALAVYGVEEAVLITTKAARDREFYLENLASSSIRSNFSDEAFWQPRLKTNGRGFADFEVTYPDDITKWNLYFLSARGNGMAGSKNIKVKSFKPIRSQLALPKFLLEGDEADLIAKTINYQSDTISVKTTFSINEVIEEEKDIELIAAHIDKYKISGNNRDTLTLEYKLEKEDGYFDGERKKVAILPVGMEYADGAFHVLDRDTSLTISDSSSNGTLTIYGDSDQLSVVRKEIRQVRNYKYLCNEQLASKLLVLLADKKIATYLGETFAHEALITELIDKLINRRNGEKLWGWWAGNSTQHWISTHVLIALGKAKKAGYKFDLKTDFIAERLVYHLESNTSFNQKIFLLNALKAVEAPIDYDRYIFSLDTISEKSLFESLSLLAFRSQIEDTLNLAIIDNYTQETLFGNKYVWDKSKKENYYHLHQNKIRNTLLAYETLSNQDAVAHEETLRKMRNYFFEERSTGCWRNTLESTRVIDAILPDLLKTAKNGKISMAKLVLSGAVDTTLTSFPFELNVSSTADLSISKTGAFPVYFTAYRNFWNSNPEYLENDLIINSYFGQGQNDTLSSKAGEEIALQVQVELKKDADYIMIEVPIPAGCSYDKKSKGWSGEVHREYFEDRVVIFCRKLQARKYQFYINLIGRYTGKYKINPAKVSLMYFPTFYANTGMKEIVIEE